MLEVGGSILSPSTITLATLTLYFCLSSDSHLGFRWSVGLREYDWLESQIPVLNRSPWIEQLPLVATRGRRAQDVAAENLGGGDGTRAARHIGDCPRGLPARLSRHLRHARHRRGWASSESPGGPGSSVHQGGSLRQGQRLCRPCLQ